MVREKIISVLAVLWFLVSVLTLGYANGLKIQIAELEKEKAAYNWKSFACHTLLDDPQTRATMSVKWGKQDKKFKCDREQQKEERK